MGFFDKIKAAKNALTGGAAEVFVEPQPAVRGQPAAVNIRVVAKANFKADGIYLLVRSRERAELEDKDWEDGEQSRETVRGTRTSYEKRFEAGGAQELAEGQEYSFAAEITIPADCNPTFRGRMIQHGWEIQAGVDATGNDPDSGWQPLEVS